MKLKQWFPLVLFAATLPLGNAQAETPKDIGSSLDNALGIADSCQASYDSNDALNIPCVNVSGVSYVVKLQAVDAGFALVSATPNSNVQGSACTAEYSVETGQLAVPCLDSALVLYADDKLSPHVFSFESQIQKNTRGTRINTCSNDGFIFPVKDDNQTDGLSWSIAENPFADPSSITGYNNALHSGEDWNYGKGSADLNKPVYAVATGTLVRIGSAGAGLGQLVVLKHTGNFNIPKTEYYGSSTTNTAYSAYTHVTSSLEGTDIGRCITKGTELGKIMKPNSMSPHLHFEIANSNKNPDGDWYPHDNGNGYYKDAATLLSDGFIEPTSFIRANLATQFDGAGSLIKPDISCYGCNKDIARMHSHSDENTSSTVVFQVNNFLSNGKSLCKYLNVNATTNVLDYVLTSTKAWASIKNKTYIATLPFSLEMFSGFSTTSITSMNPISSMVPIDAYCTTDKPSFSLPSEKTTIETGIKFSNRIRTADARVIYSRYMWAGNGSVISNDTGNCSGFGCTKDWAIALDGSPALTAFQWQASNRCKTLRIQRTSSNSANKSFVGNLRYKVWSSRDWIFDDVVIFPKDISGLDNTYYVFAVDTVGGEIPSGASIEATCM